MEFIPYEYALELKELGFDKPCLAFYEEDTNKLVTFHTDSYQEVTGHVCLDIQINAPTFSQAFGWFREKFEIHSFIDCKWKNLGWEYELVDLNKMEKISCIGNYGYKTPEEAELACLNKLIEIVKTK
jgi:hypothetical protein